MPTGTALGEDIVHGHGVRGGKAMIATLRWRLIAVPGRLTRPPARHLVLRAARQREARGQLPWLSRATWNGAKLWATGISSMVLTLTCGGSVAAQYTDPAMSPAVRGCMPV